MSYFLAFAGFAALIILHEFGHFAAAKAVGMRVERFSLFFPPLIAKVRRGETEYAIGAIPLGGYVKITGMNPNEEIAPGGRAIAPTTASPCGSASSSSRAGPAMNILIAFADHLGAPVLARAGRATTLVRQLRRHRHARPPGSCGRATGSCRSTARPATRRA